MSKCTTAGRGAPSKYAHARRSPSRFAPLPCWAVLGCMVVLGLFAPIACQAAEPLPLLMVQVGQARLVAEVPITQAERSLGLGQRDGLAQDRAMLFTFAPHYAPMMVMRGMRFDLDFVWCRAGRVVEVTPRVAHGAQAPESIAPNVQIDLVLEVVAGWAARNRVQPGSVVSLGPAMNTPRKEELLGTLSGLGPKWPIKP